MALYDNAQMSGFVVICRVSMCARVLPARGSAASRRALHVEQSFHPGMVARDGAECKHLFVYGCDSPEQVAGRLTLTALTTRAGLADRRFETWGEIFAGDAVIAAAILDRLLHHRHLVAINGPSYRTMDLTGTSPGVPSE